MITEKTTVSKANNLVTKLSIITGALASVEKKGYNKSQKYPFVRERDVALACSALFAEHNIFLTQNTVDAPPLMPLYEARSGQQMYLARVMVEYTFYDGDSDQTIGPLRFPGDGADTGDKGIYKALTGSEKYFLMKTFLIATGDDPEGDESVDKAAAGAAAGKGSKVTGREAKEGTKKGGKSDTITKPQMSEITRLVKEKGLSALGFLAVVAMTVDVPDGSDPNTIVRALSSKDAGEVITALAGLEDGEEESSEGEHDEDTTWGMTVV